MRVGKGVNRHIFLLVFISLLLRIPFLIFVLENPLVPYTSHDSYGYDAIGRNLLENRSFSIYVQDPQVKDPVRTPGYPFFLAAIYAIFPNSAFFVVLLQMILDIGMVLLLFFFGKTLVHQTVGFIAGLLYALHIHQILFATQILTEPLFATFLVLAVFGFLLYLKNRRMPILLASALCFGLTVLIRPIAVLLPVIPLIFLAKRKEGVRPIALFAMIIIVFPLLWTCRNAVVFRQFFFTKIQSVNLVLYNAPAIIADVEQTTREQAKQLFFEGVKEKYGFADYDIDYFDDDPGLTNTIAREARRIVSAYPLLALKHHCLGTIKALIPLNVGFTADILSGRGTGGAEVKPVFATFWRLLLKKRIGQAMKLVNSERIKKLRPGTLFLFLFIVLYELFIYISAIIGLKRKRIPGVTFFLLLVLGYFILIPGVVGEARFRVPIEPYLVMLAAAGMLGITQSKRGKKLRKQPL
jgi:4-amino-4-deoxy-L-arabinose transferase-like glycosyltransferase